MIVETYKNGVMIGVNSGRMRDKTIKKKYMELMKTKQWNEIEVKGEKERVEI